MISAGTVTLAIVVLTVFLIFISALRYAVEDDFVRTRLGMTAFFIFIVTTLTMAFYQYTAQSLPYTVPAALIGIAVGYMFGVSAAKERIMAEGLRHYVEHSTHVHLRDVLALKWWSVINFYSVAGALLLINFVGLSTVFFDGHASWAIATCVFGALLLGSLVPYLFHLWSLKAPRHGR